MKKIILSMTFLGVSNLFAQTILQDDVSLDRRMSLVEKATIKLIKENEILKQRTNQLKLQLNNLQTEVENIKIISQKNANTILDILNNMKQKELFVRIDTFKLNVRKKPNIKSKIVGVFNKGDLVKIKKAYLDETPTSQYKVWYLTNKGYISSKYTTIVIANTKKDYIPNKVNNSKTPNEEKKVIIKPAPINKLVKKITTSQIKPINKIIELNKTKPVNSIKEVIKESNKTKPIKKEINNSKKEMK